MKLHWKTRFISLFLFLFFFFFFYFWVESPHPCWAISPYVYLSISSPPCCLLGNMCHGVLPPLARPMLGRTQASPDAKPLVPFHLLPRFADVSTVMSLSRQPRLCPPALWARTSQNQNGWNHCTLLCCELGSVCCRAVFQCTDAWASFPHLSKYITSDTESCDISTGSEGWNRFPGVPQSLALCVWESCLDILPGWVMDEITFIPPELKQHQHSRWYAFTDNAKWFLTPNTDIIGPALLPLLPLHLTSFWFCSLSPADTLPISRPFVHAFRVFQPLLSCLLRVFFFLLCHKQQKSRRVPYLIKFWTGSLAFLQVDDPPARVGNAASLISSNISSPHFLASESLSLSSIYNSFLSFILFHCQHFCHSAHHL